MADFFKTIKDTSEGLYKEKMSKFISFAIPVNSSDEAKEIVKSYQKKYYDARHVCWAYMIGTDRSEFYSNDNGEPSGTAGKPILGQINSYELTNILIVVIRYFGGIKLGAGGLVRAYSKSVLEAISEAEIVEIEEYDVYKITFEYCDIKIVDNEVRNNNLESIEKEYSDKVTYCVVSKNNLDIEKIRKKACKKQHKHCYNNGVSFFTGFILHPVTSFLLNAKL